MERASSLSSVSGYTVPFDRTDPLSFLTDRSGPGWFTPWIWTFKCWVTRQTGPLQPSRSGLSTSYPSVQWLLASCVFGLFDPSLVGLDWCGFMASYTKVPDAAFGMGLHKTKTAGSHILTSRFDQNSAWKSKVMDWSEVAVSQIGEGKGSKWRLQQCISGSEFWFQIAGVSHENNLAKLPLSCAWLEASLTPPYGVFVVGDMSFSRGTSGSRGRGGSSGGFPARGRGNSFSSPYNRGGNARGRGGNRGFGGRGAKADGTPAYLTQYTKSQPLNKQNSVEDDEDMDMDPFQDDMVMDVPDEDITTADFSGIFALLLDSGW